MFRIFKNKETGVVWHVDDEALIKRLLSDDSYEEIKELAEQPEKATPKRRAK